MFDSATIPINWNIPDWGVSSTWLRGMGAGMESRLWWRVEETASGMFLYSVS